MSVLLIRLDKIGDLICTLPVDQILTEPPEWVISEGLSPLASTAVPPRPHTTLSVKPENWRASFRTLLQLLRAKKPKAVVVFYAPWWVSLACFWARVPVRVGRLSQWHSFLFFNRGIRQVRTESKMHEADYNLQLLREGLPEFCEAASSSEVTPVLKLQAKPDAALLTHWQIQAQGFAVVHPGMFGSALNWPSEHYQNLLQELTAKIPVVITGTADDERFLTSLRECSTHPQIRWAVGKLTLTELLSILGSAQFVIAPSTGVLHLAASLGTACVGIYSPVRVHHPRRWGPRGPNARFVLPDVECPATLQCLGPVCVHYNCMTKISVTQVLKGLL